MNLFRRLDTIPPPYSTILALGFVSVIGATLIFISDFPLMLLGVGIVIGGFSAIILKKSAEVSDRANLGRLARWLQGDLQGADSTKAEPTSAGDFSTRADAGLGTPEK